MQNNVHLNYQPSIYLARPIISSQYNKPQILFGFFLKKKTILVGGCFGEGGGVGGPKDALHEKINF